MKENLIVFLIITVFMGVTGFSIGRQMAYKETIVVQKEIEVEKEVIKEVEKQIIMNEELERCEKAGGRFKLNWDYKNSEYVKDCVLPNY